MTMSSVGAKRGLYAVLSALVALVVFAVGKPAFAHDEGWSGLIYDSLGNQRGSFAYGHHTGSSNVFRLSDRSSDGYNVTMSIDRKSGTSYVHWATMSATNGQTSKWFCWGGQVRLTIQTWVISDGLSRTETQYRSVTDCNH